jgi:hypothetical protein
MFPPPNEERFARLRSLSPEAAVEAWLAGDFGLGDESALIEAIRQDLRVTLPDADLVEAICDAMNDGLNAPACLERLVAS